MTDHNVFQFSLHEIQGVPRSCKGLRLRLSILSSWDSSQASWGLGLLSKSPFNSLFMRFWRWSLRRLCLLYHHLLSILSSWDSRWPWRWWSRSTCWLSILSSWDSEGQGTSEGQRLRRLSILSSWDSS